VNEKQKRRQEKLSRIIESNKEIVRTFSQKKRKKRALKNFKVFLKRSYNRENLSNMQ